MASIRTFLSYWKLLMCRFHWMVWYFCDALGGSTTERSATMSQCAECGGTPAEQLRSFNGRQIRRSPRMWRTWL